MTAMFFPNFQTPLVSSISTPCAWGDGHDPNIAAAQIAADEAQKEILKLLNFPEIETVGKAPAMAPKVSKCLQKRIGKLQEFIKKFDGNLSDNQKFKLAYAKNIMDTMLLPYVKVMECTGWVVSTLGITKYPGLKDPERPTLLKLGWGCWFTVCFFNLLGFVSPGSWQSWKVLRLSSRRLTTKWMTHTPKGLAKDFPRRFLFENILESHGGLNTHGN